MPTNVPARRIAALDGLRGLSILLVLFYHSYSRWGDILPWAASYRDCMVFEHGGSGVNLFFIISGFVIFMTLHTCETFGGFIYRRWLRLFPAMCIATALIYGSAGWLAERPVGAVTWRDTLPGLLFVDSWMVNKLLPVDSKVIEGAFWSIFVEVKFYVIFGALYFVTRRGVILALSFLFFGTLLCTHAPFGIPHTSDAVTFTLTKVLSLHHMGWFLIGALLYHALYLQSVRSLVFSAFVVPFATVANSGESRDVFLVCAVLYIVFVGALFNKKIAGFFSSRFFLFWGVISYPLYLIHQNMMVALTIKTHDTFEAIPGMITPIPGMILVVIVAYAIAAYAEPAVRRRIVWILSFRSRWSIAQNKKEPVASLSSPPL